MLKKEVRVFLLDVQSATMVVIERQYHLVMCRGNPWVFLSIPLPLPTKTHTRGHGCGFLKGIQILYPYPQKPIPLQVFEGFLRIMFILS